MKKGSKIVCALVLLVISTKVFSQNVGIGTNTPVYKLDVKNGSINTDSAYRIATYRVLSIDGVSNLFVGRSTGLVNTGNNNTFAGFASGAGNTSGILNSFYGANAGVFNTTGSRNTFVGTSAGLESVDGGDNSFFGFSAGIKNSSGSNNCFLGTLAGLANTTGSFNIAIGKAALLSNTTASNHIAIGDSALYHQNSNPAVPNLAIGSRAGLMNQTGWANMFIGDSAGYSNNDGFHNTYVGYMAGTENVTGDFNVCLGNYSGRFNSTGSVNTFIGYNAGFFNISGSGLTMIGSGAAPLSNNLSNATSIGYHSAVGCSNCMALGGTLSNGSQTRVGINNLTPVTDLHIIQQSNANFDNGRGIRLQSPNGNHWRVFLDPSNNYVFQYSSGLFSYIEPVGGTFISNSDLRLKTDILDLDGVLDKLMQLQPKSYQYLTTSEDGRRSYGFIAQDVEKLFPDFVFSSENGIKGLAYSNFSVIAIKAIQEQQQLIQDQNQLIDQQNQKIDRLEQQMEEILKELSSLRKKVGQ